MRHLFRAFFVLLLLATACSAAVEVLVDPAVEPADFRGLVWGQRLDSIPDMVPIYKDEGGAYAICTRKGDDMRFGSARLDSIEYTFANGRLSRVAVVAKGEKDEEALLREAISLFGEATVHVDDDYMWRFTNVSVLYSKEPAWEQSVLFYSHLEKASVSLPFEKSADKSIADKSLDAKR